MSDKKESGLATTAVSVHEIYCTTELMIFALDKALMAPADGETFYTVMTGIRTVLEDQAVSLRSLHDTLTELQQRKTSEGISHA